MAYSANQSGDVVNRMIAGMTDKMTVNRCLITKRTGTQPTNVNSSMFDNKGNGDGIPRGQFGTIQDNSEQFGTIQDKCVLHKQ